MKSLSEIKTAQPLKKFLERYLKQLDQKLYSDGDYKMRTIKRRKWN